jgi:hypothetical protein
MCLHAIVTIAKDESQWGPTALELEADGKLIRKDPSWGSNWLTHSWGSEGKNTSDIMTAMYHVLFALGHKQNQTVRMMN